MLSLLVACGGEPDKAQTTTTASTASASRAIAPPTVQQAHDLLAAAPELGDYQFTNASYTLPVKKSARNAPAEAAARDLVKGGWIGIDGDGTVVLTAKSRNDRRFLVRPNDTIDIVPLAKKELGDVSAVSPSTDGNVVVHFTWSWKPNEIGSSFRGAVADRFAGTQKAAATLISDGSSWSVLRIVPE
jgi:hypothetical protein